MIGGLGLVALVLAWGAWQRGNAGEARADAIRHQAVADSIRVELEAESEALAIIREVVRTQEEAFAADTVRLRSEVRSAQGRARAASAASRDALDSLKVHVDSSALQWVNDLEATHTVEIAAKDAEIRALRVENRRLLGLYEAQTVALSVGDSVIAGLEAEVAALRRSVDGWVRAASPGFALKVFDGARIAVPTALLVLGAVAIF